MREFAFALRHGRDTEKICPKQFKWYFKAATLGDSESILAVAEMFREGFGVPVDKKKADELYREAAALNKKWFHALNNIQSL